MEINEPQENYTTGYIKIYRSIVDHWLWIEKPYSKLEAWIFLLLRANHKEAKVNIGFELFKIERGQFISSQEKLSEQFGWSRNQVRSYLSMLQRDNMVIVDTDTKFTKITICKYDTYQDRLPTKQQRSNNDLTTKQQPIDNDLTQTRTINNVNNEKNVNNENTNNDLCFEIIEFFGFTELKNPDKLFKASAFLNSLDAGKTEYFKHQFNFYKKYKSESKEKIHSFPSFIEGGWEQENWDKKYSDLIKNHSTGVDSWINDFKPITSK